MKNIFSSKKQNISLSSRSKSITDAIKKPFFKYWTWTFS